MFNPPGLDYCEKSFTKARLFMSCFDVCFHTSCACKIFFTTHHYFLGIFLGLKSLQRIWKLQQRPPYWSLEQNHMSRVLNLPTEWSSHKFHYPIGVMGQFRLQTYVRRFVQAYLLASHCGNLESLAAKLLPSYVDCTRVTAL